MTFSETSRALSSRAFPTPSWMKDVMRVSYRLERKAVYPIEFAGIISVGVKFGMSLPVEVTGRGVYSQPGVASIPR